MRVCYYDYHDGFVSGFVCTPKSHYYVGRVVWASTDLDIRVIGSVRLEGSRAQIAARLFELTDEAAFEASQVGDPGAIIESAACLLQDLVPEFYVPTDPWLDTARFCFPAEPNAARMADEFPPHALATDTVHNVLDVYSQHLANRVRMLASKNQEPAPAGELDAYAQGYCSLGEASS